MERNLAGLARELEHRFRPEQAAGVAMRLRLATGEGDLFVRIEDTSLTISTQREDAFDDAPDVTFSFDNLSTAWQILLGEASAIDAFMHGRFRADGYLMVAFRLMEMFGSRSLPPTPHD